MTVTAVAALLIAACGNNDAASGSGANHAASSVSKSSAQASSMQVSAAGTASGSSSLPRRSGELLNPDDSTVMFLYYDLAGIPPPIDSWVEEDTRVRYAPAPDKAAKRAAVRAELESAAAGIRDVGTIRLTMNANLSDYDPSYEEFTVRALSPSSTVTYRALAQNISIRFANGNDAQVWRVPKAESQATRDRIGYSGVMVDVVLRVLSAQSAPGGGTIVANVVEYELRDNRSGTAIGRVRVAQP